MTKFPWRIFRNGSEVVFPEGARRFVSVDVRPISHAGGVERTLDGGAVWTGDPAFRLHEVQLSCSDQTLAPVFDLWPGQTVVVELPTEFSVPGPSAVLPHDPVAGSVYGVDAADEEVGRRAGAARAVSVPGAVAIRYRARLECIVVDRQADSTQWRAQAGWSLTLEEKSGVETGDEEAADWVKIQPLPLQVVPPGGSLDIDFGHPDLTSTNTGLPVQFSLNFEDVGGPRITAAGRLTWSNIPPGAHAYTVNGISRNGVAEQVIAVFAEAEVVPPPPQYRDPWASGTGGIVKDIIDSVGRAWRTHKFKESDNFIATQGGEVEYLVVSGGGSGASRSVSSNRGGGGGAGGVYRGRAVIQTGAHPATIGAGGPSVGAGTAGGNDGSPSTFLGLSPPGGGGGGSVTSAARPGGSGGGGGADGSARPGGGAIVQAEGSEWTGREGGVGRTDSLNASRMGGGGGGFSESGKNNARGGDGYLTDFFGEPEWFAGGGAGSGELNFGASLVGGRGGGGSNGGSATPNTGGGGAARGGLTGSSGAGASGIVGVRYRID